MRIASSQFQSVMLQSLNSNQDHLSRLTEQMASGQRIVVPSDDPVDSVRMSRLRREQSAVTQYRDNIAAAKVRMSKNENYLTNIGNDLQSGRDLMVWASDASNAPADLQAMATPLAALRDSILYTANTADEEGHYLFSGTMTNDAPIRYDPTAAIGSRYTYVGNTGNQQVVVGNGVTQTANVNVKGLEEILNNIDSTLAALSSPTVSSGDPALKAAVRSSLDGFDAALNLVSGKVAVLGGAQNMLTTLDNNHSNLSLSNQMALADIGQLDMAQAASDLSGYQTALQATYKAYAKIGSLTLFSSI